MKKLIGYAFLLALVIALVASNSASAHRSGCHAWHSCPSDTGSYVCGDTGHCNQCPDNYYCKNGEYRPDWETTPEQQSEFCSKASVFLQKGNYYTNNKTLDLVVWNNGDVTLSGFTVIVTTNDTTYSYTVIGLPGHTDTATIHNPSTVTSPVVCSPCFSYFAFVDYSAGTMALRNGPQEITITAVSGATIPTTTSYTSGKEIRMSGIATTGNVDITITYSQDISIKAGEIKTLSIADIPNEIKQVDLISDECRGARDILLGHNIVTWIQGTILPCAINTSYVIDNATYDLSTNQWKVKVTNKGPEGIYGLGLVIDNGKDSVKLGKVTENPPLSSNNKLMKGESVIITANVAGALNQTVCSTATGISVTNTGCPQIYFTTGAISQIKSEGEEKILEVILNLERTRMNLDQLQAISDTLANYYSDKGNVIKADGWREVSSMFEAAIENVNGIEQDIKRTESLTGIKEQIRELRNYINTIVDKVLDII